MVYSINKTTSSICNVFSRLKQFFAFFLYTQKLLHVYTEHTYLHQWGWQILPLSRKFTEKPLSHISGLVKQSGPRWLVLIFWRGSAFWRVGIFPCRGSPSQWSRMTWKPLFVPTVSELEYQLKDSKEAKMNCDFIKKSDVRNSLEDKNKEVERKHLWTMN